MKTLALWLLPAETKQLCLERKTAEEIISPVTFPDVQVPLIDDETYNPFRFPDMPYEENDELYVTVGQDPNGDYNSGAKALYQVESMMEKRGRMWMKSE